MSEEVWRPIPGWETAYEVSDQGRIKSLPRRTTTGGVLRVAANSKGYLAVRLSHLGQRRTALVHHLVAEAFIGPRPTGMQVRHLDGDKSNNAASNLAHGTQSQNEKDKLRHGTNPNAAKTCCPEGHSYLDPENVRIFRGHRYCRACQNRGPNRVEQRRTWRARHGRETAPCEHCGREGLKANRARHLTSCRAALAPQAGDGAR